MSEEKTSEMNKNIGKRVRNYLLLFALLFIFLIWSEEIVLFLTNNLSVTDKDKADLSSKVITSLVSFVSSLILFFLNLGRDIDLHNLLDKSFFHVRERTNDIISSTMKKTAESLNVKGIGKLESKGKDLTNIFYHFVNKQIVLRTLAFTYWEQYFVNIYIVSLSGLFSTAAILAILIRWKLDFLISIPIVYLLLGVVVGLYTKKNHIKKLYDLPIKQIDEIKNSKKNELREQLSSRFSSLIQEG